MPCLDCGKSQTMGKYCSFCGLILFEGEGPTRNPDNKVYIVFATPPDEPLSCTACKSDLFVEESTKTEGNLRYCYSCGVVIQIRRPY